MIIYQLLGRVPEPARFHEYICSIFNHFLSAADVTEQVIVLIRFQSRCQHDAAGFCYALDDQIQVELARGSLGAPYTLTELALHLAHELVHVWQQIQLSQLDQAAAELEAYALEQVLLDLYWNK